MGQSRTAFEGLASVPRNVGSHAAEDGRTRLKTRRLYFLMGIIILSTVSEADERWDSVPH
jgi:hypothetical protein